MNMASQVIAEISRSDLTNLPTPFNATITGLEHLASYNWLEKSVPTISVPGKLLPYSSSLDLLANLL